MRVNRMIQYFSSSTIDTDTLPANLMTLFSVFTYCQRSGNELIGEMNGVNPIITNLDYSETTYIPGTSTCTISLPNTASLKVDDSMDGGFYTDAGAVKQITISQLQNNDYSRILVRYSDESPYDIEWIGLLDDASNPTSDQWDQLHFYFKLGIFWSGVFNDYGILKDNRPLEGQGYKNWLGQLNALSLTLPSDTVKASVNKFCLDLRNYGIDTKIDRLWMLMLNDSSLVSGAGSVSLYNPGSNRMTFPVAPTYTVRGIEGNGTSMYALDNYNPTTDRINYSQDSAAIGFYQYKLRTIASPYIHGTLTTAIDIVPAFNTSLIRINGNSIGPTVDLNTIDYIAINRSASNAGQVYKGTTQSTGTGTSSGYSNSSFTTLRSFFGYSDTGLSMKYISSSLTQTEHGNFRTAFLAHKTRLGL